MKRGDVLISVEGVSKKFCRNLKRSLWYGIKDLANEILCRDPGKKLREKEFWALRDISFELRRGEILGIIGANGSGKTTLLRLINGLIKPDKGKITITGRIGALIALGAGFNPILTGRENIYINAAVLGLNRKEIDALFDDIIDFAEIGDFIDSPVKFYSSGMYVRLGFSIAVHCDPEILLVDEILSVGDAVFRMKSMNKMLEIVGSGMTICFVSHNLQAVEQICSRVLWLHNGKTRMLDDTNTVMEKYKMYQREMAIRDLESIDNKKNQGFETGLIWITESDIVDENNIPRTTLHYRDHLILRIGYKTKAPVNRPYFMVYLVDWLGHCLFQANMLADGEEPERLDGEGWLTIDFGNPPLLPGVYLVKVQIRENATTEHYYLRSVAKFTVDASPKDYGFRGTSKSVYTFGAGIAQPYEYHWGPGN